MVAATSVVSDWVGRVAGDPSPIVYYSGQSSIDEDKLMARIPHRYRCVSYGWLTEGNQTNLLGMLQKNKVRIFLDSGAYTFQKQNKSHTPADIDKLLTGYVDYVRQFRRQFRCDFYVTMDYRKDCQLIRTITRELIDRGIHPVPAYHGDDSIDWLKRYIDDGHPLIGIGCCPKTAGVSRPAYYDHVFDVATKAGIDLHGFAQTGVYMFQWPWYSCDSSTWLKAAGYGFIVDYKLGSSGKIRMHKMAITNQSWKRAVPYTQTTTKLFSELSEKVAARGFDMQLLRTSRTERIHYNLLMYEEMSRVHNARKVKDATWKRLL